MFRNPVKYFAHWLGRRKLPKELTAGDLCSALSGEGDYVITKVLARDPGIVHIRIYKERFGYRPERINTALLSLGSVHDDEGCGIGHLPLAEGVYGSWQPEIIHHEAVTEEELDGYRIWQESSGGAWE
jgi:hypothetical protein